MLFPPPENDAEKPGRYIEDVVVLEVLMEGPVSIVARGHVGLLGTPNVPPYPLVEFLLGSLNQGQKLEAFLIVVDELQPGRREFYRRSIEHARELRNRFAHQAVNPAAGPKTDRDRANVDWDELFEGLDYLVAEVQHLSIEATFGRTL